MTIENIEPNSETRMQDNRLISVSLIYYLRLKWRLMNFMSILQFFLKILDISRNDNTKYILEIKDLQCLLNFLLSFPIFYFVFDMLHRLSAMLFNSLSTLGRSVVMRLGEV